MSDRGGFDQACRGHSHGMEAALDLALPEIQEFVQHGITRCDVEILPDIGLQNVRMVRQMIEDLSGGEAIILQLANKGHDVLLLSKHSSVAKSHPGLGNFRLDDLYDVGET